MEGGDDHDLLPKRYGHPAVEETTRPKAWQQLWLDKHREVLARRLQGVVVCIADRLVGEGHLDPALETYQFISSAYTLPVDRVRRLLDWLRGKSQQVFNQFQCALIENGCGDLVASEDAVETDTGHARCL